MKIVEKMETKRKRELPKVVNFKERIGTDTFSIKEREICNKLKATTRRQARTKLS